MTISQEIKDRVEVRLEKDFEHVTSEHEALVYIVDDDSKIDGTVRVCIGDDYGHWVGAEDAEELSVFFKKLAKKLRKAYKED